MTNTPEEHTVSKANVVFTGGYQLPHPPQKKCIQGRCFRYFVRFFLNENLT